VCYICKEIMCIEQNEENIHVIITFYHMQDFLPRFNTRHTLIVFQAEGRLMAFGDFIAIRIDYIESGEHFHRVIMPAKRKYIVVSVFYCQLNILNY